MLVPYLFSSPVYAGATEILLFNKYYFVEIQNLGMSGFQMVECIPILDAIRNPENLEWIFNFSTQSSQSLDME